MGGGHGRGPEEEGGGGCKRGGWRGGKEGEGQGRGEGQEERRRWRRVAAPRGSAISSAAKRPARATARTWPTRGRLAGGGGQQPDPAKTISKSGQKMRMSVPTSSDSTTIAMSTPRPTRTCQTKGSEGAGSEGGRGCGGRVCEGGGGGRQQCAGVGAYHAEKNAVRSRRTTGQAARRCGARWRRTSPRTAFAKLHRPRRKSSLTRTSRTEPAMVVETPLQKRGRGRR